MCVLLNLFKMSRHLADHDYHCVEEVAEAMEAMEVSSASEDEEGKRREKRRRKERGGGGNGVGSASTEKESGVDLGFDVLLDLQVNF